jgi:hypothetical protein
MDSRSRLALSVSIALAAPAMLSIAAGGLHAATGISGPAALVDAAFGAFGVSNTSPLPVRQAWYFGAYILAPAIAMAIGVFASTAFRPRVRWPFFVASAAAALSALFWVVYSLADA